MSSDPLRVGYPGTPVPMLQRTVELDGMLNLYKQRKPASTLEVGSYAGGTLYHWLQNAPKGAVVVAVDTHGMGVDNRHLYESWTPGGVSCVAIRGDSHTEATADEIASYGPFEFVFVDADHSYAAVAKDWELALRVAAPGGMVAFHDILGPTDEHPEIEVSRLWGEIKDDFETVEFVADRSAPWGGIGVAFLP